MANVLFLSVKDLKKYSSLSANIDDDKLIQFAQIAHDMHIQFILGTDLYARLKAGIVAADLTADETSLLNNYVKWMAIYWSLVEIYDNCWYEASNNGVFRRIPENAETLTVSEIEKVTNKYRDKAEFWTKRFQDYMCYNNETFPQYDSNTDEDIRPTRKNYFGGWQL